MISKGKDGNARKGGGNRHAGITFRAVILGLALSAAVAAFTPFNDYYLDNTYFIGGQVPIGVYAVLLFIALGGNVAARICAPGSELRSNELVIVLCLTFCGASVAGCGMHRFLLPTMAMPFEHAHRLKDVAAVMKDAPLDIFPMTDTESPEFQQFLVGGENPIPWGIWFKPLIHWLILCVSAYLAMMFLALFLARQWSRNEHLQFPLAVVPLAIMEDPEPGRVFNSLFRNPWMWSGLSLVLFVQLLHGLNAYFRKVPSFTLEWYLYSNLTEHPWNYLPYYLKHLIIYPSAAALAFLIPQAISFSFWFFMILLGIVDMLQAAYGPPMTAWVQGNEQMGGFCVLIMFQFWVARDEIAKGVREAVAWIRHPFSREGGESGFSLVAALFFGAVATAWLAYWGMGWFWATVAFTMLMIIHTLMARLVAEGGQLYVGARAYVSVLMIGLFGVSSIGVRGALIAGLMTTLLAHDLRESILPFSVTSFKLQEEKPGLDRKRMALWMIAALLVAVASGIAVQMYQYYHFGARVQEWHATTGALSRFVFPIQASLRDRPDYSGNWTRFLAGAMTTGSLVFMRARFHWWPFHPLGFVATHSYGMQCMWFSILLGWFAKWTVQRYGGVKTVLAAHPFVIGTLLGDCMAAAIWMFVAVYLHLIGLEPISIRLMPG
ncbi:MAG TPA: hypothetical protein PL033_01990 [Candidatus Brocadiia bacterium]|nr:hypothetical protein [Candidatus Brocadiia bacterium]